MPARRVWGSPKPSPSCSRSATASARCAAASSRPWPPPQKPKPLKSAAGWPANSLHSPLSQARRQPLLAAWYGVSELLVKALPILLCALGLAVAYQARIWNIGAEGQLLLGALAGSAMAIQIIDWDSRWALVWVVLAGVAAGAAWGGLTAWLRTQFNANEILTSIMLNYIALNLLLFFVHGPLKDPAGFNFPESAMFGDASRLPLVSEDGRLHAGLYFALLALVAVWVLLHKSFLGFQIKVLGLDRRAAGFEIRESSCA